MMTEVKSDLLALTGAELLAKAGEAFGRAKAGLEELAGGYDSTAYYAAVDGLSLILAYNAAGWQSGKRSTHPTSGDLDDQLADAITELKERVCEDPDRTTRY